MLFNKDRLRTLTEWAAPKVSHLVCELDVGSYLAGILRTATGWAPSESTLLRHFHRSELMGPATGAAGEVFGRFEAPDPNELWVGDALHGPRVGDRKTYLFAFLDDHSRLVVGHRFGFAEDTVRLAAALKPALAAGWSWCSPRSIWKRSRSATGIRVSAPRSLTPSPAMPIRKPDPRPLTQDLRRR